MYIQWSVDGIDYGDAEAQDIYERSVRRTQNGDIILLHNGTKNTAAILPKILEALECKYEFVTVSELIYKDDRQYRQTISKIIIYKTVVSYYNR